MEGLHFHLATGGKAGAAGAGADARSVSSRAVGRAHTDTFSVPVEVLDVQYPDGIFLPLEISNNNTAVIKSLSKPERGGPQRSSAHRKSANLLTELFVEICGTSVNLAICGFADHIFFTFQNFSQ